MAPLQLTSVLLVAFVASVVLASPLKFAPKCDPQKNCKLPNCRCPDDPSRPGNLSQLETPQIILVTFDYSFNNHTTTEYERLFRGLKNPNGCPAKGTFFVQSYGSEPSKLKALFDEGHELAINSERGIIPDSQGAWLNNIEKVLDFIQSAGVNRNKVHGVRSPQLASGGNDEFSMIQMTGMKYDSSCIVVDHSTAETLLWPYTTDFVEKAPYCSTGKPMKESFAGIWEFPVPVLSYHGQVCPTPAGCIPTINKTEDVFSMFYEAFDKHYYASRAPFMVDIDPQWVTDDYRTMGTKQFLEIIDNYEDTWILTVSQALEWIKDPQPLSKLKDFKPWDCPEYKRGQQ